MRSVKTFTLSLLWFVLLHTMLWCALFSCLLLDNFDLFWLLYVIGFAAPIVYLIGGLKLPKSLSGKPLLYAALVWGIGMFLLVFVGDYLSVEFMWTFSFPHRFCAMTWLFPLFNDHHSASARNVLQPLAVAGSQILMMSGFALGLFVRRQNARKE